MLFVDIRLNPKKKINYPKNWNVFEIHPDHKDLDICNFVSKIEFYPGINYLFQKKIEEKLSTGLVKWISSNLKDFQPNVIQFSIEHFKNHFSMQYASCYSTAEKIFDTYSDCTLICSKNLKKIDLDWNSEVINLIAFLDVARLRNIDIAIKEVDKDCFSEVLKKGMTLDSYENIYKNIIQKNENCFDISKIFKKKFIYLSLTEQRLSIGNLSTEDTIAIIPKSLKITDKFLGGGNFFIGAKFNKLENSFESCIAVSDISIQLEKSYFNAIGTFIISYFSSIKFNISKFLLNRNIPQNYNLILEEIVDLENLPLISAAIDAGYTISLVQHSMLAQCGHLKYVQENGLENILPKNYFYKSQVSYDLLKAEFGDSVRLIKENSDFDIVLSEANDIKPYITIFENAFFYSHGSLYSISQISNDIISFVSRMNSHGFKKFIWRQRDGRISPIYLLLIDTFNDCEFIFNFGTPIEKLSTYSNVSVGFGSTSSVAIKFIALGGVYFFGSKYKIEHDYCSKMIAFYNEFGYGALCAAEYIINLNKNKNFLDTRSKQIDFISKNWL